tara:strand:+ start:1018 stop:2469 length:1452 start_codon:yes stop_codon:yes gene_type:complete
MAWGKAGSTTLGSAGDDIDITDLTTNKFNQVLIHGLEDSANITYKQTINNDGGSLYAFRRSGNGGADGTGTSEASVGINASAFGEAFIVEYIIAISGEEKLGIAFDCIRTTAGAGSAPNRDETVFKYVPATLTDTIDRIDVNNSSTGNFATSSNISVLGSDITPAAAVPFAENAQVGSRAEITDTRKMYHYTYDWFLEGTTIPYNATRGIFGGGNGSSTIMDYITIDTLGNATDFGDLTVGRSAPAGVSSSTRGVFCGGHGGGYKNTCDYVTIASAGNATDFGDLTSARQIAAGVESDTRGVIAGGDLSTNIMDYITIATTGNAIDFGDLTLARYGAAGVSSTTRGVFCGGDGTSDNVMDYITIASTGNATDFGDLSVSRFTVAGVENDTRGCISSGYDGSTMQNVVDYITISTLGNATDFGDMTVARQYLGGLNSATRGVFGGGTTGSVTNVMDYITIASTGNATDFGDLTVARSGVTGVQA